MSEILNKISVMMDKEQARGSLQQVNATIWIMENASACIRLLLPIAQAAEAYCDYCGRIEETGYATGREVDEGIALVIKLQAAVAELHNVE